MSKQRELENRQDSEKREGKETIQTGLPSDRFSTEKQISSPDELGVTSESTPDNVTNAEKAAKMVKSKMHLRPDVSLEDLGGKQVGGVPLAVDVSLRNVAGARTQSPADDMSRTPYSPGNYRPTTRYGKKRSEDLFELDNAPIEQVVPIVEDCPDLRADPKAGVGYNGRQQFKQTRQKKNFIFINGDGNTPGKLPQQLLNDASVDFDEFDQVVYTSGQIVTPVNDDGTMGHIDPQADYPTYDGSSVMTGDDIMHKSNYMPTALKIKIENGRITKVSIDEYKFNAVANPIVRDEANFNWQIDANNIAKTMVKIQKEMGRETTDKWTPLAYVITQPYQYNMLMHDIESTTGALMALAYRAAVASLAFQRNLVRKDGINPQRNAIKMIAEGYAGIMANNDRNTISNLDLGKMVFNKKAYREGSAAAIIDMFDSTPKYRTKADLLGLQRSFGLHLQQADNNIAPFRVRKEFIKALDKAHVFSTITGEYNAFLPVYATKKINPILPLSLNRFLNNWKNPALFESADYLDAKRDKDTGTYAQYVYQYNDLRNVYTTIVQHPVIEGLLKWLLEHEGAFTKTYGDGDITIPFDFNMQAPAALPFYLCSASQNVARQRNIIFRDVLFAGEQETYIWDDLVSLKEIDPLYSSQLKIGKYDEPLTMGKVAPDVAIRLLYGDHKQLSDHANGKAQYYEPWYLNEEAFDKSAGGSYAINRGFFNPDTPFNMSYPSIRDGVRHEYVDIIKSMSAKDVMLSLDRKLDILRYCSKTTVEDSNHNIRYVEFTPIGDSTTNNNKIKLSSLRYDANSDGRIVSTYNLNTGDNLDLYALGLYCIPKELGWIEDNYNKLSVITSIDYVDNVGCTVTKLDEDFENTDTSGVNTNYYNGGKARWITSYRIEADSPSDNSISRSAALTSTFYRFFATTDSNIAAVNSKFIDETGIVVTRSYNDGVASDVPGVYNLGSKNEATQAADKKVNTLAPMLWTAIQRWFSPINVFANAYSIDNVTHSYDPFEMSFIFGICGILAADYTQHVLERLSEFDQLGFDYTEDSNIKNSLIFRS